MINNKLEQVNQLLLSQCARKMAKIGWISKPDWVISRRINSGESMLYVLLMVVSGLVAKADQIEPLTSTTQYRLIEDISGSGFFSHFNFETFDDPTHGYVDYVTQGRANYLHLLSYDPNSKSTKISVDSTGNGYGRGRSSVRLESKSTFNSGLFIIDVNHIPEGNATWPAFWLYGPHWPVSGEIDIIEGKNDQTNNQSTLHTTPICVMPTPNPQNMTGSFPESLDCNHEEAKKGCSSHGPANSFGPGFNKAGGGVYATLWNKSSISVWYWPRNLVPNNISLGQTPDPSQWGLPVSYFPFGANCSAQHFLNQKLVLNTTFCGDWAGSSFIGATGSGIDACNYYVSKTPSAFTNAYWDINYIRIYSTP